MTALPKNKRTSSRQGMKRNQIKAEAVATVECPECHEMIPSHTACPNCGKYNGRQVINKD